MFPVVKIKRKLLDTPITFFAAMMDCEDGASAVAAFPNEPGDSVEFAWWSVPNEPCLLPTQQ